jgi:hypothetical protein
MSAFYIPPGSQAPRPDPSPLPTPGPAAREPLGDDAQPAPQPNVELDEIEEQEAQDQEAAPLTFTVTFFPDFAAKTKREQLLGLNTLAQLIHDAAAPAKEQLPWLKLARFGDTRTEKGSLRHNTNLVAITGIEADYDRGEMSLADAKDIITGAGIMAIIYPSPSYTPEQPKWRVLCPFSQGYAPEHRDRFTARLNGLFGGIFSRESWTLSQSYYYGRVNNPDHHATVFNGIPIDLAHQLDVGAIGLPPERNIGRQAHPKSRPEDITEARVRGLVHTLLDNIRNAAEGEKHFTLRNICLTLGGYLHVIGWSVEEAVEQAIGALPSADDWDQARETARWGIERGMERPLDLEERPNPRGGRGGAGGGGDSPEPAPATPQGRGFSDPDYDVLAEADMLGPELTLTRLIEIFNCKFAVVDDEGKPFVMWAVRDEELNRERYRRATFADFQRLYQNRKLAIEINDANGKRTIGEKSYALRWLDHPRRRQYLGGVTFDPAGSAPSNKLNLWRGFTVEPRKGDWSLMHDHIRDVICAGDRAAYDYLIRWLARMVQFPWLMAEVAVVLRGEKGVGKGILGRWLCRLFGQHALHIVNAEHLVGRFNSHLRDCIFIFADECFYAGDRRHESVLKGAITEEMLLIEAKYQNPTLARNVLHILMASNADYVVPASGKERRYFVRNVSDARASDHSYFDAINRQTGQGGLAAMLYDLLRMDLTGFNHRAVAGSPELEEQKLHSLGSLERWWLAVLDRGFVWKSRFGHKDFLVWEEFVTTELLVRAYNQWCAENRVHYPESRTQLGRLMAKAYKPSRRSKEFPVYERESVDRDEPNPVVNKADQHGWDVGSLHGARGAFAKAINLPESELPWG